jgi:predicted kinase
LATVHLIHGCLGAGKTTFAKKLAEEVNGVRFNPDEWMVRLYGEDPPADPLQADEPRLLIDTGQTLPEDCQNLKDAP